MCKVTRATFTLTATIMPEPSPPALLNLLADAPAARLTAEQAQVVMSRDGYKITGVVLCHPVSGDRCIVEMSACRWLTKAESWWLMHISKTLPAESPNPQ